MFTGRGARSVVASAEALDPSQPNKEKMTLLVMDRDGKVSNYFISLLG